VRIAVINPNTTRESTDAVVRSARAVARPGTEIFGITPNFGPESCEGWHDSFVSAAAVIDAVQTTKEPYDALVMAGFGEHGRQALRELVDVPVVDMTEAAVELAYLIGDKYGIITSLARTIPLIEDSLRSSGLLGRCAALLATEIPVLDLDRYPDRTTEAFVAKAQEALDRGADVLILGCGGMSQVRQQIQQRLQAPVVDGVAAAIALAESLHHLGLTTSKVGSYAPPLAKLRTGWPVSGRSIG
jgi:allantoin racemase